MKKRNSIIFLLCLLLFVFTFIPVGAANEVTFTLSKEYAKAGEDVSVTLSISDNPGIAGMAFTLIYDDEILEYTGYDSMASEFTWTVGTRFVGVSQSDTNYEGALLKLNFKVMSDAQPGDSEVTIQIDEGDVGSVGDAATPPQEYTADIVPGKVIIIDNDAVLPPAGVVPTSITLDPSGSAFVKIGDTLQITASVQPSDASDKTVSWTSSDPAVASVDANGLVTAVSEGTAVITVTSNANPSVTAQISVTVTQNIRPPLPHTGFSGVRPQAISEMPKNISYKPLSMTLEIPTLSVTSDIVKVPLSDGEYAVTWLGDAVGLLEGSAMPGKGTAFLAAHNHLNNTEAGPFAMLSFMEEGERIFVRDAHDQMQSFVVYANVKIAETDPEAVDRIAEAFENALIMITCEDERVDGGYASRRIVAARPLDK